MPTTPSTTTSRPGLAGRYFIGTIDNATVCGKVAKQVRGEIHSLHIWRWDNERPQHYRVVNVADPAFGLAFFNTISGLRRAKEKFSGSYPTVATALTARVRRPR